MKEWGQPLQRAEIGHLIGYQDLWGSTAKVLLDRNRVVHSRNVTWDSKSVTNLRLLLQRTEVRVNLSLSTMRLKGLLMASQPWVYQSTRLGEETTASLKKALLQLKKMLRAAEPLLRVQCLWSTLTRAQRLHLPLTMTLCLKVCLGTHRLSRQTQHS